MKTSSWGSLCLSCHQNENIFLGTLACTLVYSVIERVKEGNFSINLLLWSLQTTPYIQFVIGPVINNCCRKYFQWRPKINILPARRIFFIYQLFLWYMYLWKDKETRAPASSFVSPKTYGETFVPLLGQDLPNHWLATMVVLVFSWGTKYNSENIMKAVYSR